MTDTQRSNPDGRSRFAGPPGDMVSLVAIAYRWRRFIVINVLAAAVVSVAVSLLLPKWYKSTASIIPPKDQDMLNPLNAAGSVLKGLSLGKRVGGGALGTYNYLAILKSRSVLDSVVRRFNLIEVYDVGDTSMEEAIKELKENAAFELQDDDFITIEVYDRDPQRAADMANAFVDVLNTVSLQLGTREAGNNREFIERRLDSSRADLRRAEDALRVYQEKSKMIVIPEQNSSASVGGVAELYGMKAKKEIELAILQKSLSPGDPSIGQLQLELAELDKKLESFPEIGIESIRLYRDALIQQKIVEFLLPLYEQAKVDEHKDVPVLLVLDRAVRAEKKTKPQRSLIVLASVSLALLVSLLLAFLFQKAAGWDTPPGAFGDVLLRYSARAARLYRVPLQSS